MSSQDRRDRLDERLVEALVRNDIGDVTGVDAVAWMQAGELAKAMGFSIEHDLAVLDLRRRDGRSAWVHFPDRSLRLWLPETWAACRRLYAADVAERALDHHGGEVDPRSREAIRVARKHARGQATDDELAAARTAAEAARHAADAEADADAARDAAEPSSDAYGARWDAERAAQAARWAAAEAADQADDGAAEAAAEAATQAAAEAVRVFEAARAELDAVSARNTAANAARAAAEADAARDAADAADQAVDWAAEHSSRAARAAERAAQWRRLRQYLQHDLSAAEMPWPEVPR